MTCIQIIEDISITKFDFKIFMTIFLVFLDLSILKYHDSEISDLPSPYL